MSPFSQFLSTLAVLTAACVPLAGTYYRPSAPDGVAVNDQCGAIAPKALIANYGASNQNFNSTFEIRQSGNLLYTSTKPVTLNSGVSQVVIYDSTFNPTPGTYTAKVYTSLAGDGDEPMILST